MTEPSDAQWMRLALAEADRAAAQGEVPVGAVVVKNGVLVATGRNSPKADSDPCAHAEINALRAAGRVLGNYRLTGCTLFVTLEPCAMCAGAIAQSRLDRVVWGAADPKAGAAGSVIDLFAQARLNHHTRAEGGVLADDAAAQLAGFFDQRREAQRNSATPLRDDALRTPAHCFAGLGEGAAEDDYAAALPLLSGWRLHAMDVGPRNAPLALVALHGPGYWGHYFSNLVALAQRQDASEGAQGDSGPTLRVLVPDLIGHGRSDKPKREAVHRPAWHAGVLGEWIASLTLPDRLILVVAPGAEPIARKLEAQNRARWAAVLSITDLDHIAQGNNGSVRAGGQAASDDEPMDWSAAWQAPFPDRGHEAALRAFGCTPLGPGLSRQQTEKLWRQAMQIAMRYCAP